MAYALIDSVDAGGDANGATTGAINSSGADFLAIITANYDVEPVVSDSKGNTYTPRTLYGGASDSGIQIYYATSSPTVGSSHTASALATNSYAAVCLAAFSGAHATAPADQQNGGTAAGGTDPFSTGSITPSENDCLVITGASSARNSALATLPSGYSRLGSGVLATVNIQGLECAYVIQTTATATNPSWDFNGTEFGGVQVAGTVSSFKPAGGGGGGATIPVFMHHYTQQRAA